MSKPNLTITANNTISSVPRVTSAEERSRSVGTGCTHVAVVGVGLTTLIKICSNSKTNNYLPKCLQYQYILTILFTE